MQVLRIAPAVPSKIGYYVYAYVDPRNRRPFYIGKGKGSRVLVHLAARGNSHKATILRDCAELDSNPKSTSLHMDSVMKIRRSGSRAS